MERKDAVVIHSGGMDSSICLVLAQREFGCENVLALSFDFNQRHKKELKSAKKICSLFNIERAVVDIRSFSALTSNALLDSSLPLENDSALVVGRNGLMARLGAIHAHHLGADCLFMGVMEENNGYRDCSRAYMDKMEEILRIDLNDPKFVIRTPLVKMTKLETLEVAKRLGILQDLLTYSITCYEGIGRLGCKKCPACLLRNEGLRQFSIKHPEEVLPYSITT